MQARGPGHHRLLIIRYGPLQKKADSNALSLARRLAVNRENFR
jgi:hypothetical protein